MSWSLIEQFQGTFIWTTLDEAINNAIKDGKKIVLNLMAGGANTPAWVMSLPGTQLFSFIDTNPYRDTYCQEITMPVFWDPIFLGKKKNFITVAGKRYAGNNSIVGVMVSFCNPILGDWNVPHAVGYTCGQNLNQVQDWLDVGYTTEKMFNAGQETIDAWATAFPKKILKLPIGPTHRDLDGDSTNLTESIANYAYSKYPYRFFVQINALNARTYYSSDPDVVNASPGTNAFLYKILFDHSPQIGLQMLDAATNGDQDGCRLNGGEIPLSSL